MKTRKSRTIAFGATSLAVVALTALATLPVTGAAASTAPPEGDQGAATPEGEVPLPLDCAWSGEVSPTASNVYYPDTGATYWATPYEIDSDTTVEVTGSYPDARYMSLVTYQPGGGYFTSDAGVDSYLADHQIEADRGSKNPYTKKGKHAEPGGDYTVEIAMDAKKRDDNTLPMAPNTDVEGEVGYLVFRVYEPAGGDASQVELPEITLHSEDGSTTLPECAERVDIDEVTPDPYPPTDRTEFARQPVAGLFPNPHNHYVTLDVDVPTDGDVLVVQGKAPQQSGGQEPVTWPNTTDDVRYWSMCSSVISNPYPVVYNETADGETAYGCATDDQTEIADDGTYTYVIGTEDQREQVEAIPGATFLPFSTEQADETHKILMRQMLPASSFDEAIVNVPEDSNPESAQDVMGEYYPDAQEMSLEELTTSMS